MTDVTDVTDWKAEAERLTAERDAALAELERAREVLESLQWVIRWDGYTGEPETYCPSCGLNKTEGHAPDCALSAALAAKGE